MKTPKKAIPESKTCSKCGELKPLTDFHKDKSASTGHSSRCKICSAIAKATSTTPKKPRKPRGKPVPTMSPEQIKKSEANRAAILRLIENHRAEFNNLVYSEQVRSGLTQPGERPLEKWINLI